MRRLLPILALAATVPFAATPAAFLRSGRQAAREARWEKAEELFLRTESQARLLDDASLELAARSARIDLRLGAEELDSAEALLTPLPRRALSAGDSAAWNLSHARVALARRKLPEARAFAEAAQDQACRSKETPLRSVASATLSRALLESGDLEGATKAWKKARRSADDVPALEASSAALEARLALARGDAGKATKAADLSLSLWRSSNDIAGVLATLPLRAAIATASADTAAARESWDAAAHIAETTGLPLTAMRSHLMASSANPAAGAARRERARQILSASGLDASRLDPALRELLR